MKNEKEILNLYVGDGYEGLEKPFTQGDFVFATEAHILIRVRKSLCDDGYQEKEKPNALKVLPITHKDKYREVPVTVLDEAIRKIPLTDQHPVCDDCDGSGEVDFEYIDHGGFPHYRALECPLCDGLGYLRLMPTTKERDPQYMLSLCGTYIYPRFADIIIKTARMLGRDTLMFLQWPTPDNKGCPFILDLGSYSDPSGIRIALMPLLISASGKVIDVDAPSLASPAG